MTATSTSESAEDSLLCAASRKLAPSDRTGERCRTRMLLATSGEGSWAATHPLSFCGVTLLHPAGSGSNGESAAEATFRQCALAELARS
jgi:hypothetical protein